MFTICLEEEKVERNKKNRTKRQENGPDQLVAQKRCATESWYAQNAISGTKTLCHRELVVAVGFFDDFEVFSWYLVLCSWCRKAVKSIGISLNELGGLERVGESLEWERTLMRA